MLDISIEECIRKVTLLEKSLGTKIQYQILDPFPLYSKDIVGIQNAGKIIAEFIGLSDYIFVISINKLEKNTGGHIELKYGNKQVFIEISEEILTQLHHNPPKYSKNSLLRRHKPLQDKEIRIHI